MFLGVVQHLSLMFRRDQTTCAALVSGLHPTPHLRAVDASYFRNNPRASKDCDRRRSRIEMKSFGHACIVAFDATLVKPSHRNCCDKFVRASRRS